MSITPFEMNDSLDSMVVYVDTREQKTQRAEQRYATMGCPVERKKLDFADYTAAFKLPNGEWLSLENEVAIERKQSIDELCMCYCKDRERFTREFERAAEAGAKVYLLIEDCTWEKIYAGRYRSKMRPSALVASLCAWQARFKCWPEMCKPETSGKLIHDILYREGKERLEAMVGNDG